MSTQTQTETINGVDAAKLHETVAAIDEDRDLARFRFRATNRWIGGTHNRSCVKGFYGAGREDDTRVRPYLLDNGEPAVLCGGEEGANPVEHLLNALAGCLTTSIVMHATARGITVRSVESRLEGDLDLCGFLGLDDATPRGYQDIRVNFTIDADADEATLTELSRFSPVFNTLINATPVEVRIEKA